MNKSGEDASAVTEKDKITYYYDITIQDTYRVYYFTETLAELETSLNRQHSLTRQVQIVHTCIHCYSPNCTLPWSSKVKQISQLCSCHFFFSLHDGYLNAA